jgi:predicted amidophosphoribosyltransferase
MEVRNCPRCGKVFVKRTEPICDSCVKEEEHIFENVREYIKENPNKSIKEVAEDCDVTVKRILQYLRDGKIETSSGMQGEIKCSQCGKPILTGRMCEKCILETNFKVQDMKAAADIKNRGQVFTRR